MKKIFTTSLIASLFLPSFVLGLTPPTETKLMSKTPSSEEKSKEVKEALRGSLHNASSTSNKKASSTKPLTDFCSQIDKIIVAIDDKVVADVDKHAGKVTKKDEKRDDIRTQIDTLREHNRLKRITQLEELSRKGTTLEQKKAIENFTAEFTQALILKNKAIDDLIHSHREEIDALTGAKKDFVTKSLATLKTDIETAKIKARSDCTKGVSGITVRTDLKNALQKAQADFKKKVLSLDTLTSTSTKDISYKKSELLNIEDAFKKSLARSRVDLITALKTEKAASSTNP